MRIVLIGNIFFTYLILKFLKKKKFQLFVISSNKNKFNSDSYDLKSFCKKNQIKFYKSLDINNNDTFLKINNYNPNLILCIGFSYLIKDKLINKYKNKIIGYHPTNLPYNRGRHPIIWSISLGLKSIYSCLFLLDKGIDTGKIIKKKKIKISKDLFAIDVYRKLAITAKNQLNDIFKYYKKNKKINYKIQKNNIKGNIWRKRNFEDGKIDWRMGKASIINLVRALSTPYPGAHFLYKNKPIKVFKIYESNYVKKSVFLFDEPGKVVDTKNGVTIRCYDGYLKIKNTFPSPNIQIGDYL